LTKRLEELNAERDGIKDLTKKLETIEDVDLLDPTLFKEFVAEAIEYIKIESLEQGRYDFADECYTAKQEVVVLVTIKLLYDDFKYMTIISRRSKVQFMFVRVRRASEYNTPPLVWRRQIADKIKI
jgi:hypothetical protein